MSDLHKSSREDVKQKPADELYGVKRHGFLLVAVGGGVVDDAASGAR